MTILIKTFASAIRLLLCFCFHGALRLQKPYGLLGTEKGGVRWGGGGGVGYLWVPSAPTRKDRRDREPPPEWQRRGGGDPPPPPPVESSLCTPLIAVSTAVRNKVTKTHCPKRSCSLSCFPDTASLWPCSAQQKNNSAGRQCIQLREPSSTSLLLISRNLSVFSVFIMWILWSLRKWLYRGVACNAG